jgi:hypothetical protein
MVTNDKISVYCELSLEVYPKSTIVKFVDLLYMTYQGKVFAEKYAIFYVRQQPKVVFGRTKVSDLEDENWLSVSAVVKEENLSMFNYEDYLRFLPKDIQDLDLFEVVDPLGWVNDDEWPLSFSVVDL